jgi:hypothetical protein
MNLQGVTGVGDIGHSLDANERACKPELVKLCRISAASSRDDSPIAPTDAANLKARQLHWIKILRDAWKGCIIRRTSNSRDPHGNEICKLLPLFVRPLMLPLSQIEQDVLDKISQDGTECIRKLGKSVYTVYTV